MLELPGMVVVIGDEVVPVVHWEVELATGIVVGVAVLGDAEFLEKSVRGLSG